MAENPIVVSNGHHLDAGECALDDQSLPSLDELLCGLKQRSPAKSARESERASVEYRERNVWCISRLEKVTH